MSHSSCKTQLCDHNCQLFLPPFGIHLVQSPTAVCGPCCTKLKAASRHSGREPRSGSAALLALQPGLEPLSAHLLAHILRLRGAPSIRFLCPQQSRPQGNQGGLSGMTIHADSPPAQVPSHRAQPQRIGCMIFLLQLVLPPPASYFLLWTRNLRPQHTRSEPRPRREAASHPVACCVTQSVVGQAPLMPSNLCPGQAEGVAVDCPFCRRKKGCGAYLEDAPVHRRERSSGTHAVDGCCTGRFL